MSRYFRELSVAAALVLLLLALALFAPHFFALQPLLSRLTAQAPTLVAAIGITLVIISRQIDISVGSQFGMCAVIAGLLAAAKFPLALAVAAAIGAGAVMGALNGLLVAGLGLPSIVVTLATMVTWQEALRLWQQGRLLNLPAGMQWFGFSQPVGQSILISFAVALLVVAAWAMKNLAIGRRVYAVGTDAEAARLAGLNPQRTTFGVFVSMGVLAGLAAVMNVMQSPQVQPTCGDGLELKVIAAAVVGGVAVSGGRGSLWGVFPGLLLLANVNPALTHFHVQAYWEKAIQGFVILLAVMADGLRSKRK
ncbi:MAG TPA: ABC transporter permease [Chthoniobacteraceae bacterium]|jgi:rhamnose transport system permease protein|nr:ABC transporter permease [Chthoniobacteraceae bacterium]